MTLTREGFLAVVFIAGLTPAASAGLPDFAPPSPQAVLAQASEAPATPSPTSRPASPDIDGRTLSHSRSEPRHRFDLSSLAGSYRLEERADPGRGCIDASRTGDDAISIVYDHRVSQRSWASDDHFVSLSVRTPADFVLDFLSDIDQGPMQYTRHDVENPTLADVAGCVAWFGNLGLGDAYRYCQDSVLPKWRPEPAFNPSYAYREETRTTTDGEVVSESLSVARASADRTAFSRKVTSLKLAGGVLTITKLVEESGGPVKTLQRCVYRRL